MPFRNADDRVTHEQQRICRSYGHIRDRSVEALDIGLAGVLALGIPITLSSDHLLVTQKCTGLSFNEILTNKLFAQLREEVISFVVFTTLH